MSIAAYNRGSRLVAREADERMPVATSRATAKQLATMYSVTESCIYDIKNKKTWKRILGDSK